MGVGQPFWYSSRSSIFYNAILGTFSQLASDHHPIKEPLVYPTLLHSSENLMSQLGSSHPQEEDHGEDFVELLD